MKKLCFLILPVVFLIIFVEAARIHARERSLPHTSIFTAFFDDVDEPQSRISLGISHKAAANAVSRYTESKSQRGTYMRTQFDVLVCEEDPCEQRWSAAFVYTDETGKADTFGLIWKQIVFTGMTPSGTIKRELNVCLNGQCANLEDPQGGHELGAPQEENIGRYHIRWAKSSLAIMRSDMN